MRQRISARAIRVWIVGHSGPSGRVYEESSENAAKISAADKLFDIVPWPWSGQRAGAEFDWRVRVRPNDPILIEAGFLSHPGDNWAAISCVEMCRAVGNSAALRPSRSVRSCLVNGAAESFRSLPPLLNLDLYRLTNSGRVTRRNHKISALGLGRVLDNLPDRADSVDDSGSCRIGHESRERL